MQPNTLIGILLAAFSLLPFKDIKWNVGASILLLALGVVSLLDVGLHMGSGEWFVRDLFYTEKTPEPGLPSVHTSYLLVLCSAFSFVTTWKKNSVLKGLLLGGILVSLMSVCFLGVYASIFEVIGSSLTSMSLPTFTSFFALGFIQIKILKGVFYGNYDNLSE
jgi:hypothetical protein